MCGILGTVNLAVDENTLDPIQHRGPDDSAIAKSSFGNHLVTWATADYPSSTFTGRSQFGESISSPPRL
jgi:asparagine synthetase B (glutamine-hydrolysing)